ncbi:hypothetical protein K474DRAFT_1191605 [Panus rudis PR-1116 ss-1]|nr:hypothetical protein K474DRAFT_1191605 [Panus rudis PR-1116 ss-1]
MFSVLWWGEVLYQANAEETEPLFISPDIGDEEFIASIKRSVSTDSDNLQGLFDPFKLYLVDHAAGDLMRHRRAHETLAKQIEDHGVGWIWYSKVDIPHLEYLIERMGDG